MRQKEQSAAAADDDLPLQHQASLVRELLDDAVLNARFVRSAEGLRVPTRRLGAYHFVGMAGKTTVEDASVTQLDRNLSPGPG